MKKLSGKKKVNEPTVMPPHQLMAKLEGQLPAAQKACPCVAVGVAAGVGLAAIAIELHWNKSLNTRFVMDFFCFEGQL